MEPISVSELSKNIKILLENEFGFVYVTGEISNFKHHSSGHYYFAIKDEKAQISALMWNSRNQNLGFKPEDGMKVIIKGRITVFESRGTYQIDVFEMDTAGTGALQIQFEKLKKKLLEEGLFDEIYKKKLPQFPEKVAVITSETGAVIEDFKKIAKRRYPYAKIFLIPVLVQGVGSKESICRAIQIANKEEYGIEVIVIARGGGSIEDLWTFNEEEIARSVFASKIPVVSAIGHEVDFTICDFVADVRASTPSAAAEIVFPDKRELLERINRNEYNLKLYITNFIKDYHLNLENISRNYFFRKPVDILNEYKLEVDEKTKQIEKLIKEHIGELNTDVKNLEKIMHNISPVQTLKRGYTYIIKDGKIIARKSGVTKDDRINIKFFDGEKEANILK